MVKSQIMKDIFSCFEIIYYEIYIMSSILSNIYFVLNYQFDKLNT